MSATRSFDRPVKLRHDDYEDKVDEVDEDHSEGSDAVSSDTDDDGSQSVPSERGQSPSEAGSDASSASEDDEGTVLNDISFGALAKAQESFGVNPRKRKAADTLPATDEKGTQKQDSDFFDTRKRSKEARIHGPKRSSKHAPAVESARKPVSRMRAIFDPSPALKFRDPRFDPTVMTASRDKSATDRANKNYSFLSAYQASEILDLKSQIKKSKDPAVVAQLKRQVMSMEAKIRNAEIRQKEGEIRSKHKQQEKAALSAGQKAKPYFLKDADVRKMVNEERLQAMGKQARDKAEKRKLKRDKTKEARDMPRARRDR